MPAITTYTNFSNAAADLVIAGVRTKRRFIPNQIETAMLPLQFPRLPEGSELPLTADSAQGGWPTLAIELVIALEPFGQDKNKANHAATLAMIDAANDALRAAPFATFGKGKHSWSIRGEQGQIGENDYWLVVIRIVGNG